MGWKQPEGYVREFGEKRIISNMTKNVMEATEEQTIYAVRDGKISMNSNDFKEYINHRTGENSIGEISEDNTKVDLKNNKIEYIVKTSDEERQEDSEFKETLKVDVKQGQNKDKKGKGEKKKQEKDYSIET